MKPIDADIVVVGGGVAGAATARFLAEAGHHTILLDRATFPRDKPCGEGIMPTGVRLLDRMGILARIPLSQRHVLRGVRFVLEGRAEVSGPFPDVGDRHDSGMGIRRLVLDHQVLEHARSHPLVEVHESEAAVDAVWPERGLPEVITPTARYRGRLVVGADGIRSLIRRKRGLEVSGGRRRFGMRSHFALTGPCADHVTVYVDPIGEFYTTPVGPSELQVALLVAKEQMKPFAGRLEAEFHRRIEMQPALHALLAQAKPTSKIIATGPFDVWPRCRVADRALLVGDAGGYLDPITGEGISIALQCAVWAAEVVDGCLRRDRLLAAHLMPYHRRMNRALRHYKLLTRLLLFLCRHQGLAANFVRHLGRCPELYSDLLAINCGVRTFWDLRPRHLLRFASTFIS